MAGLNGHVLRSLLPAVSALVLAMSSPFVRAADNNPTVNAVLALDAEHRAGQTFLTWTSPPGTGWVYRIYGGESPITGPGDLATSQLLAAVGDSTWYDRRLSQLRQVTFGYVTDSLSAPLNSTKGLCVVTAASTRSVYYAVTTQQGNAPEDNAMVIGQNSLATPIAESVTSPRPVYQRTLTSGNITFDVYTLWTSHVDTPLFPAMASVAGLAFDSAVVRGTPGGSLFIKPHARGGSFLNTLSGTGTPGEWRLTLDDHLYSSADRNSFWYGYHEDYDPFRVSNPTPVSGTVFDYTLRRIVHTVGWGRSWFPVDTTRVYATGGSMGGIGSLMLAYRVPAWIAAIQAVVPKFDFSFTSDPNPANLWNAGSPERLVADHLWGSVPANLLTNDGLPAYDRQNQGFMAGELASVSLPVIMAFNGKHDTVVGWAEKIGYYGAALASRHGGYYFFDQRAHGASSYISAWAPMQDARYLYRFRTNRSYPALSGGSADHDPGDGNAASGDSVGTLNGFVEWDSVLVDNVDRWEVSLWTRDLMTLNGPLAAPDSLRVNVTPRRLQRLVVQSGFNYSWRVERIADGVTVQSGTVAADAPGLVTIPGALVYRSGSRLILEASAISNVKPSPAPPTALRMRVSGNPVRGRVRLSIEWPAPGRGKIDLMDVAGRHVRTILDTAVAAGAMEIEFDPGQIVAGRYYLRARTGSTVAGVGVVIAR